MFFFFPGKRLLILHGCHSLKGSERNSPPVYGLHCLTSRMWNSAFSKPAKSDFLTYFPPCQPRHIKRYTAPSRPSKKWIFSSYFDYHNVIRRFREILKHFQGLLDGWRIWSAVFFSLVVDNCSWNLCSECCQMFFGCGLNKAVTRTHRYVEISWRHVLMNAYHVIIFVIIIDIFRSSNDLNNSFK